MRILPYFIHLLVNPVNDRKARERKIKTRKIIIIEKICSDTTMKGHGSKLQQQNDI